MVGTDGGVIRALVFRGVIATHVYIHLSKLIKVFIQICGFHHMSNLAGFSEDLKALKVHLSLLMVYESGGP